jgi:tetratricopeptide (TPR) repeat protein
MSLLLDALKKAEKAKEEAQRRAKDKGPSDAPQPEATTGARLADDAQSEQVPHVRTRDELPDISQPLEIASDDLNRGNGPREGERELALEAIEPAPPPPAARQRAASAPREAGRAAAKKVFEAKMREPNPRLPFYVALGVLGAVALGTVVYFWYQLRPPTPLVASNPPPVEQPVALAANANSAQSTVPPTGRAAARQAEAPGLPGLPAALPASPEPRAQEKPPATEAPTRRTPARATPPAPQAAPAAPMVLKSRTSGDLTIKRPTPYLDPAVASAYAAYQAGDWATARRDYEQALKNAPANRDALLGMAALEMRAQRGQAAESYYRRLLRANPRDPHALAGILALRGQQIDPVRAESRVKTLLVSDPGADVLNFTLGNEYARQGRWAEAQQAYFKALSADPGNPDFAYNLAVSLEHIGKPKLALEQYRQALALAQQRSPNFDQAAARKRVQELDH